MTLTPSDIFGLLGSLVGLAFLLGLVWVMLVHWSGIDV